ncbi:hypothetical protein [Streptomyces atroolivaceus]|uniref:hypothetical protein n=1 Tax=Streptomyces atroolivaceus TaxID=66869 RepID=UPI0036B72221
MHGAFPGGVVVVDVSWSSCRAPEPAHRDLSSRSGARARTPLRGHGLAGLEGTARPWSRPRVVAERRRTQVPGHDRAAAMY